MDRLAPGCRGRGDGFSECDALQIAGHIRPAPDYERCCYCDGDRRGGEAAVVGGEVVGGGTADGAIVGVVAGGIGLVAVGGGLVAAGGGAVTDGWPVGAGTAVEVVTTVVGS
jgi:hypothetical protein